MIPTSIAPISSLAGYSPRIELALEIGRDRFAVAEVGPNYVVVRSTREIEPGSGKLIITIDGQESMHQVSLPEGISHSSERQPLLIRDICVPT